MKFLGPITTLLLLAAITTTNAQHVGISNNASYNPTEKLDVDGNLKLSATNPTIKAGDNLKIKGNSGTAIILNADGAGTGAKFEVRDSSASKSLLYMKQDGTLYLPEYSSTEERALTVKANGEVSTGNVIFISNSGTVVENYYNIARPTTSTPTIVYSDQYVSIKAWYSSSDNIIGFTPKTGYTGWWNTVSTGTNTNSNGSANNAKTMSDDVNATSTATNYPMYSASSNVASGGYVTLYMQDSATTPLYEISYNTGGTREMIKVKAIMP